MHLEDEDLTFYALGWMSGARGLKVSSHIAGCGTCADKLEGNEKGYFSPE